MNDTVETLQINIAMFVVSACSLFLLIYLLANTEISDTHLVLKMMLLVLIGAFNIMIMGLSAAGFGQYFYIRATERAEVT